MGGENETSAGLIIFDGSFRILKMGDAIAEFLGLNGGELSGLNLQDLLVDDAAKLMAVGDAPNRERRIFLKRRGGEIAEAFVACQRIEEGLFYSEWRWGDSLSGQLATRSEGELSDRDQARFLSVVSQELQIALASTFPAMQALGKSELSPKQHAELEKINACYAAQKALLNDLQAYTRAVTANASHQIERVELATFLEESLSRFLEKAEAKGIGFEIHSDGVANDRVAIARVYVAQALGHLVASAIKRTEIGRVAVHAKVDAEILRIEVRDTGQVFEIEGRATLAASADSNDDLSWSSLGIMISKQLAQQLGGGLYSEQPAEGGNRYVLELPRENSVSMEDSSLESDPAVDAKSENDVSEKRLLVVEDNQLNADILGHFLQDYGVGFDRVDNGKLAVEAYQDDKYDLILMDVMLPEMNGYEATERILAKSRRKDPVPIVGVTAKVFRRDQTRCIEAGMVEVVHKPVDFKQLREVLDYYLYSGQGQSRGNPPEVPMFVDEDIEALELSDNVVKFEEGVLSQSSASILNTDALESYIDRMKNDASSRSQIIDTAVSIVDSEVQSLLDSINSGERKEISMRAHSLKGALALLGAKNILDLAKGLEIVASDGGVRLNPDHWRGLISQSYEEFKSQLESYMEMTTAK